MHAGRLGTVVAGADLDLVGDHESGIEAEPEVADDLPLVLQITVFPQEFPGRGECDLVDLAAHFIGIHADAIVADRQGSGDGVNADVNRVLLCQLQPLHQVDRLQLAVFIGLC